MDQKTQQPPRRQEKGGKRGHKLPQYAGKAPAEEPVRKGVPAQTRRKEEPKNPPAKEHGRQQGQKSKKGGSKTPSKSSFSAASGRSVKT